MAASSAGCLGLKGQQDGLVGETLAQRDQDPPPQILPLPPAGGQPIPQPAPSPSPVPSALPAASVEAFRATLFPLIVNNCTSCHGANQPPRFAPNDAQAAHDAVTSMALVNLADPPASRLVQKLTTLHQGFGAALATDFSNAIKAWSDRLRTAGAPPPAAPVLAPTFKSISALILQPKCVGCHGAANAEGGIRYDTHAETLRTVNAGNPAQSQLIRSVTGGGDGVMPPNPAPGVTSAERNAMLQWIQGGALNN